MPSEPAVKRCVAFIDGQNLFYAAKDAFGYREANYDPQALARAVCVVQGWNLAQVRFYTGIHDAAENARLHQYWTAKLAAMGTRGIWTFVRTVRYEDQEVTLTDGTKTTVRVGREKGVDVRLALDLVRLAREGTYDVGLTGATTRGSALVTRP